MSTLGNLSDDLDTADVEFQHNFSVGARNKFVWGLGYRFTHEVDQNDAPPGSAQVIFRRPRSIKISPMFLRRMKSDCSISFISRSEQKWNTTTTPGLKSSRNVRLQWTPTPKQMFWGAISRAVRTPSRLDHDLQIPSGIPIVSIV